MAVLNQIYDLLVRYLNSWLWFVVWFIHEDFYFQESGSSRKKGSKKDKNAPKRAQSAFMIFMNEHREQIKRDNPGIAFTDIAKKRGEMWRELSDKSVGLVICGC